MLTQKKRLYAQARLVGKNQTDSAIYAGCPAATAAQAASRYEKDPEIVAHMARLKKGEPEPPPVKRTMPPRQKPEKEVFVKSEPLEPLEHCDPLDYLKRVMNDPMEDPKLRLDAAKTLASYMHAKPGEKGKKEQRQEKAETVASRFAPAAPPKLVAAAGRMQ